MSNYLDRSDFQFVSAEHREIRASTRAQRDRVEQLDLCVAVTASSTAWSFLDIEGSAFHHSAFGAEFEARAQCVGYNARELADYECDPKDLRAVDATLDAFDDALSDRQLVHRFDPDGYSDRWAARFIIIPPSIPTPLKIID
jgi:hypothetical protein